MAEGFARAYGSDVLEAQSAGLGPALAIAPLTHLVMLEKNIDLGECYPKEMIHVEGPFDLIVNMSGQALAVTPGVEVEQWDVRDPIGESEEVFRQVRDEVERRVKQLVERIRGRKPASSQKRSSPASASSAKR